MASRGRFRRQPGVAVKPRQKAKGRPGHTGPAASRFPYARPPLGDVTQVMGMSKSKAKPSEGTPQSPVDRGFAADYFGASPVASALNLPAGARLPRESKSDYHALPTEPAKTGHFYFAQIGHSHFAATVAAMLLDATRQKPYHRSTSPWTGFSVFVHRLEPPFTAAIVTPSL